MYLQARILNVLKNSTHITGFETDTYFGKLIKINT